MNLVLFEADELSRPLPSADPRSRHVLEVLRRAQGEPFDAGLVDGPIGTATIEQIDAAGLHLRFAPLREPPALPDLHLIVGLPRPATARDVLRDATTCGARAIHFVACARTQASYAQSSLWESGEWRRHLLLGAAQAFDTRLPTVTWGRPLAEVLAETPTGTRVALDNYEASSHLAALPAHAGPITLAIGPERGWGPADRDALRGAGFALHHLGTRVLRVEMAVVAAAVMLNRPRPPGGA